VACHIAVPRKSDFCVLLAQNCVYRTYVHICPFHSGSRRHTASTSIASLLIAFFSLFAAITTVGIGSSKTVVSAATITGFTQVATGNNASCAVKTDTTVWCWGHNNSGQLGNGNTTDQSRPVAVSGLTGVTQVDAHEEYACALKTNGTVWCWGSNAFGQLGNGTTVNSSTPVQVTGLTGITQITTGYGHACALKSDNTVRCWGWNILFQLGDGSTATRNTPVTPDGLGPVAQIRAGVFGTCALLSDSTVRCWGAGNNGGLGDGNNTYATNTKTSPTGISNVSQLSANPGWNHACVILTNQTVKCWGLNDNGQVGNGSSNYSESTPVVVSNFTNVRSIAGGPYTSCAVKTDNTPWCWGWNGYGGLGVGDSVSRNVPTAVSGLTGVTQIATGYYHSCAVLTDTSIKCWGRGETGAMGDGSFASSNTPVTVSSLSVTLSTPAAVTATATSSTTKSISVDWNTVSNASSYLVSLYDSSGNTLLGTKSINTGSTATTITTSTYSSLADGTSYKISVTAIGNGSTYLDSSASAKVSVTTNATPTTTTTTTTTSTTSTTSTTTPARVVEIVIQAPTTTIAVGQSAIATIAPESQKATAAVVATTSSTSTAPPTTVPVAAAPKTSTEPAPSVPKLDAGEGAVAIDGETVKQTLTRKDNQLQIQSGSLTATLSRTTEQGSTAPLDKDGNLRLAAGDILKISLGGFKPDSQVGAWLFSPATKLGKAQVKSDGTVSASFRIPTNVKDGLHRVAVVAELINGKSATFTMSVVIGKLKTTSTLTRILIVIPMILAVLVGVLLPNRVRRRRKAQA